MKKIIYLFLFSFFIITCSQAKDAVIKGNIGNCNWKGHGYFLLVSINNPTAYDTIKVDKAGNFTHVIKSPTAGEMGLFLEYLGDDRGVVSFYVTPGANIEANISGEYKDVTFRGETVKQYLFTSKFAGDNVKESEYLNIPEFYDYKYIKADGSPVTYKEFRSQIAERQNFLKGKLAGCAKDFVANKMVAVNAMQDGYLFAFARRSRMDAKYDATKDADFMAEVSKIDINDVSNYSDDQFDKISSYIEFDLGAHPDLYKGDTQLVRILKYLRDKVTNPKVRELVSDKQVDFALAMGNTEDIGDMFNVYKSISGKSDAFKANEKVYNSLSKLNPGTMAMNFTMQDKEGKTHNFLDVIGQGKIVYIDFWATWCGPCCGEIPFVEKLVEHYKNNSKIEFISISLDHQKNKWIDKIAKDKPTWRQFIIPEAFKSAFAKEYNITAIPRFMIFDGEGKIITIDADRPSDEGIIGVLDDIISKGK